MYELILILAGISFIVNMVVVEYAFKTFDQIKRIDPEAN